MNSSQVADDSCKLPGLHGVLFGAAFFGLLSRLPPSEMLSCIDYANFIAFLNGSKNFENLLKLSGKLLKTAKRYCVHGSFPSAASTKKKAPPLANRSAGKGLALRCYPPALLNCMALAVLPIVYQRFGYCAWLAPRTNSKFQIPNPPRRTSSKTQNLPRRIGSHQSGCGLGGFVEVAAF